MSTSTSHTTDHATTPVPLHLSVPAYRVALVSICIAFTLTGLYTGSELATQMGLAQGMVAVLIGSIVLSVMSLPAALMGARTRLSTYMIVRQVFGRRGAALVNLALALVLLGWYAVTAELFGRTCFLTVASWFPQLLWPQWVYTVSCSAVVTLTAAFGFRAIERLSLAVAPLLVILTAYVGWRALAHTPWQALMHMPGQGVGLSTGISAVIGGMIVNVVLMPDITRYSRSMADCTVISLAGNGLGGGVALVLAMLPALAFGEIDPMKYMIALGMLKFAFVTLILSTWTINAVNLYSTGLVSSSALRGIRYRWLVCGCGPIGTLAALSGLSDHLISFLVVLGLVVPPIAAVYLTDFFLLGRTDFSAAGHDERGTNLNGLLACLAGGAVGVASYVLDASLTGVPAIESFVCAAAGYALAERLRARARRDRAWRRQPA
jgi:cytosine permease